MRVAHEYLDLYYEQSCRLDQWISIVLAVASSGSVAIWAIWNEYRLIWAIIIGATQVLTVIRPYLPFKVRTEQLPGFSRDMALLFVRCERELFKMDKDKNHEKEVMSDEKINNLLYKFKEEYVLLETDLCKCKTLPHSKRLMKIAEERKNKYFEIHLPPKESEEE